MRHEIRIPQLGWSVTEATINQWLVTDGSQVDVGTPIYILETDKVENEIECTVAGVIRFLVEEGETLEIGTTIAEVEA